MNLAATTKKAKFAAFTREVLEMSHWLMYQITNGLVEAYRFWIATLATFPTLSTKLNGDLDAEPLKALSA